MSTRLRLLFLLVLVLTIPLSANAQFNLIQMVPGQADDEWGINGQAAVEAPNGDVLVWGTTASPDFPVPGGCQTVFGGAGSLNIGDGFLARFSPEGRKLLYATYLGGSGGEDVKGLAVDGAGSAYVTGFVNSVDFPTTPGAIDDSRNYFDAYVAKLNPAGTALEYATYLGGDSGEMSYDLAVDEAGAMHFVEGNSKAGDHVDLRAEMDTLVVLNSCPHPMDPSTDWSPPPVELTIYRADPVADDDACMNSCDENRRGFANTAVYHCQY